MIYPNPGNGTAQIALTAQMPTNADLKIYNSLGAVVVSKSLNNLRQGGNVVNINTENLAPGVYTFQINVNEEVHQVRWIKK